MEEKQSRVPYAPPRVTPAEMLARARAHYRQMDQRRSVRDFSDEPVPIEAIADAIRAASTAPSGAHMQPWTFVVVDDSELKSKVRQAAEEEERQFYADRAGSEWLSALAPLGTDWEKPHLETAPYLIICFMQSYGVAEDGAHYKHYYAQESMGIAVGMLIAAIHHIGLATLPHTPNPMAFLTQLLKRPQNERPFALLPVGYPAADATVPDLKRKELAEVMVRNLGEPF